MCGVPTNQILSKSSQSPITRTLSPVLPSQHPSMRDSHSLPRRPSLICFDLNADNLFVKVLNHENQLRFLFQSSWATYSLWPKTPSHPESMLPSCVSAHNYTAIHYILLVYPYVANFFFRFVFCLILLTKLNINRRTIGKGFFLQSKLIVEEEVFVDCLRGQPLKSFYIGLFYFGVIRPDTRLPQ